jgi:hypothetical protein
LDGHRQPGDGRIWYRVRPWVAGELPL